MAQGASPTLRSQPGTIVLTPKEPVPEIATSCPGGATYGGPDCWTPPRYSASRRASRSANSASTERALLTRRHIRTAYCSEHRYSQKQYE